MKLNDKQTRVPRTVKQTKIPYFNHLFSLFEFKLSHPFGSLILSI